MKIPDQILPPENIRAEALKLWQDVWENFNIDGEAEAILRTACISLSRFLEARDTVDEEGMVIYSKAGIPHKHPCVEVEKMSRQGFLSAMKNLNLQWEEQEARRPVGRPTGSKLRSIK